jgi:lipopolysaccharide transport system ATP-binding protein
MSVVIKVENLSKRFKLGLTHDRSIRDLVNRVARGLLQRPKVDGAAHNVESKPASNPEQRDFWALRDVSFDVQAGEVLGIIGKNGAGKSTLLKILSRITKPTSGHVKMRGRVASLLEVGTGFHPELTGRENVYLNGTVLGMTRREIDRRFDEIVAFAEVEKFIDTPVKRYSSGMCVRLGFAVAAHLTTEILIVDEVLAVGDIQFQRKCVNKMRDVAGRGKTVLFVSHNLGAVQSLCSRGIVIDRGTKTFSGTAIEAVADFQRQCGGTVELFQVDFDRCAISQKEIAFTSVGTRNRNGELVSSFRTLDDIYFAARIHVNRVADTAPIFAFAIHDAQANLIANVLSTDTESQVDIVEGANEICATWRNACLKDGQYFLSVWVGKEFHSPPIDYYPQCLSFFVDNSGDRQIRSAALVHAEAEWSVRQISWNLSTDVDASHA